MLTGRTLRASIVVFAAGALTLTACGSSSKSDKPTTTPTPSSGRTISAGPTASASTTTASTAALLKSADVSGDTTTIAFTEAFVKALYTRGVNTAPVGKAGLDDTHRAQLPITSGSATLYGAKSQLGKTSATLHHKGSGLKVVNTRTQVSVSNIVLTLGAHPAITAELSITSTTKPSSPTDVRLFDLTLTKPAVRSSGGVTLSGVRATLDPQAARELDAAFGTSLFSNYGSKLAGTVTLVVTG